MNSLKDEVFRHGQQAGRRVAEVLIEEFRKRTIAIPLDPVIPESLRGPVDVTYRAGWLDGMSERIDEEIGKSIEEVKVMIK